MSVSRGSVAQDMTFAAAFYQPMQIEKDGVPLWVPGVRPIRREMTWPALVSGLTRFRSAFEKARCPGWQPVRLTTPYRRKENVREVSCLVLDLDDGAEPEEAAARFAEWPHLWHTTWGSKPDAPKARLVIPLAAPCPARWFPRLWAWGQRRVGGAADEQSKDASRYFYLPAVGPAGDCRFGVGTGAGPLDLRPWEDLPETAEERAMRLYQERERNRPPLAPMPGREDRFRTRTLNHDPEARAALGLRLGGRLVSRDGGARYIEGVTCPRCGRRDVWWPLVPAPVPKAMCAHMRTCGWMDWLDRLEGVAA